MLSKAVVFVFATLGIFAVLMGAIPPEFITATFNPSYTQPEVKETFEAADILMYENLGADNMTYPYSSLYDGPNPPDWEAGLPSGQYCEVWWSHDPLSDVPYIGVRHATHQSYGYDSVPLEIRYVNGTLISTPRHAMIEKEILVGAWDTEKGYSAFYASGPISVSVLFYPTNRSKTISEAWDEGKISYALSYEVNWNQTGVNAWTIVAQLLTFQVPNLGIGGDGGTILTMVVAFPVWALIAYIVYKIVAGIIPFLSGGSGD